MNYIIIKNERKRKSEKLIIKYNNVNLIIKCKVPK